MERENSLSERSRTVYHALDGIGGVKIILPLLALMSVWLLASSQNPADGTAPVSEFRALAPSTPIGSTNRCTACHRMDSMLSHPVEITPTMAVPSELPLEMGKITCLTCHQEGGPEAHTQSAKNHDGMLRVSEGENLCRKCHMGADRSPAAMHGFGLGQAHLSSPARYGSFSARSRGIDNETMTCMTCHDGTLASEGDSGRHFGDSFKDHPVGVPYSDSRLARGQPPSDVPLVPVAGLNPKIRLFDGQVGCGSCHSPYSKEKHLLVMSNYGSKLCLSCHRA